MANMKSLSLFFIFSIYCTGLFAGVDFIYVKKSEKYMSLYESGEEMRRYKIALGASPEGHKQQEGDERTPEGLYKIIWKNEASKFHLSLKINYPNKEDKRSARRLGVNPGGDIMIHGLPNNLEAWLDNFPKLLQDWILNGGSQYHYLYNWTDGCIAVTNEEIQEIWALVKTGTPIKIEY
jgi:murein L,D-transpeptidase YafK